MTALAADRNTAQSEGEFFEYPVLASTKIYEGSIVVLDSSGYAKPGATATGLISAGIAQNFVDNSAGANGDLKVKVRKTSGWFVNSDSVAIDSIGDFAYIVDDQTVAKGSSGKSVAGLITDIDTTLGVKVDFKSQPGSQAGLLAANNLSDVGTAATAAHSLGLGTADTPVFTGVRASGFANKTTTYAVLAADSGSLLTTATDGEVFNLPDNTAGAVQGMEITIFNKAADGAALVKVEPHAGDHIYGQIGSVEFGAVVSKGIWNTKATQKQGDFAKLKAGSTDWYVVGGIGVWASEA